jgi:hypothetical protein
MQVLRMAAKAWSREAWLRSASKSCWRVVSSGMTRRGLRSTRAVGRDGNDQDGNRLRIVLDTAKDEAIAATAVGGSGAVMVEEEEEVVVVVVVVLLLLLGGGMLQHQRRDEPAELQTQCILRSG